MIQRLKTTYKGLKLAVAAVRLLQVERLKTTYKGLKRICFALFSNRGTSV